MGDLFTHSYSWTIDSRRQRGQCAVGLDNDTVLPAEVHQGCLVSSVVGVVLDLIATGKSERG